MSRRHLHLRRLQTILDHPGRRICRSAISAGLERKSLRDEWQMGPRLAVQRNTCTIANSGPCSYQFYAVHNSILRCCIQSVRPDGAMETPSVMRLTDLPLWITPGYFPYTHGPGLLLNHPQTLHRLRAAQRLIKNAIGQHLTRRSRNQRVKPSNPAKSCAVCTPS